MILFLLISFSMLLFRDTLGTLTTQHCQEDEESSSVNTGNPNAPSGLTCYTQWRKEDKQFQCTWKRGKDPAEYRLCYCCDTCKICRSFAVGRNTSYIVQRNDLYLNKNLTFWVETANGNTKVKSAKLYVVPQTAIKYKPPSLQKVKLKRSADLLTISWKKPEMKRIFNEIRYRRNDSEEWKQINCSSSESKTHENCRILLDQSSAYQLQIRRILQNIWSKWSGTVFIPAVITERLGLQWRLVDEHQHCPGKRKIELKWKPPTGPDVNVTGYNLTFQPITNMTGYSNNQKNKRYQTMISLAPYKVSIVAFNSVSTSPAETITIPAAQPEDTPGLNLTAVDNRTLKASWIPHNVSFYCAVLELVSTETTQQNKCHLELKKKKGHHHSTEMKFMGLEPQRRYRLTIYARDSKEGNECYSQTGYTFGSVTACTQEHPPTHAPTMVNVTNIMKSSVFLRWKGISLGECQGTLEKYLIIYTDSWNHTHTASVNASNLNFTLMNLNASTLYTVQICAVTSAGQGAKTIRTFQTKDYDRSEFIAIIVATSFFVMLSVFVVVSLCYFSFKRTERMVCPTVPDPVNSLAVKSMHVSNHISQWEACTADEDVMDVLLVMVGLQSDTASPRKPATGDAVPMTEGGESLSDNNSLGFESDSAFEYKRQMGCPLGLEEDCGSETGLDVQLETQTPLLETCHISPLPQTYSGSGLNLCGNVISLLSVYDQTLAEQEPARSNVYP
ncbi:interleukin-12 receptor subunit beta-1-like isoform X2 [Pristis pectinata]|uniref:interleukin-12 receptor subunit beta-1-like isoform X2 n=1 Tax=Pristis pectinata TaxID=685728 RepID=UPI00223DA927|nr:interleukin-12 receptor subunit beta-1-like isoform X2 [Pristis pectinata]